ncbi:MAG: hypothetical protein ACE5OY_02450 [Candidatus Bathyarchaeia archaeon]
MEETGEPPISEYLTLWWVNPFVRFLVLCMALVGVLDSLYTLLLVGKYGLYGEANLLIRWFFERNLELMWAALNILITFLGAGVIGSFLITLESPTARFPTITVLSTMVTVRVLMNLNHVVNYHKITGPMANLGLVGLSTFITVEGVLVYTSFRDRIRRLWDDIDTCLSQWTLSNFVGWLKRGGKRMHEIVRAGPKRVGKIKGIRKTRLLLLLLALIALPFILLTLIDAMATLMGIESVSEWIKFVAWTRRPPGAASTGGWFTQVQGRIYLVSFGLIIVFFAIMMYVVMSIWDMLSKPKGSIS